MVAKYMIAACMVLVACGGSSASIGDPMQANVEEETEPSTPKSDTDASGSNVGSDGGSPKGDAGSTVDASTSTPDAEPAQDAALPPPPPPPPTDAGSSQDANVGGVCPGYVRVHVAVGTCVKVKDCTGYILIGSDGSAGAGSAGFTAGAPMPSACVSSDQDACSLWKHTSSTNPKPFDVFLKANNPTACTITTYQFTNGSCPANSC